jgi:hypothetical protein
VLLFVYILSNAGGFVLETSAPTIKSNSVPIIIAVCLCMYDQSNRGMYPLETNLREVVEYI